MSLGEHFREFRRRALVAVLAIIAGAFLGWMLFDPIKWNLFGQRIDNQGIFNWLKEPLTQVASTRRHPEDVNLNFGGKGVTSAFEIKLKIALWVGLIVSSPVWLWQIWGFLAPGLTKREKRISRLFLAAAVPLFVAGCWVATLVLPNAVRFLIGVTPDDAVNYQDGSAYITFVTRFILVFGIAFLLPVFLVGLNAVGVLPAHVMIKGWRVAVLLIFVFAAVMSPSPDAWSMLALALPMVALFYLAVGIGAILDKRRGKKRPEWLDVSDGDASAL
ncbi:twin-arginine translocase subunit TatC [Yimella sp. cx-51]|uniref:twin-arginine translocase subunit TatC n=1 Tax=Yimella sp. cx-51 TaxID=2770551 RepID=UPI00165E63C0|nr:twin-arginine translocase subunit TatC [Yimella sp. cx-51]MBC9957340.1 twin-arginine translocase subunit TatC [Yimella sp. cx-51]QTH39416.1 twin-arginine translocase subunit TatC [Yimella sp. cx-51]